MNVLFIVLAIISFFLISFCYYWLLFPTSKKIFFIIEIPFFIAMLSHIFWYLGILDPKLHVVAVDIFVIILAFFGCIAAFAAYERAKNQGESYKFPKSLFWATEIVFFFVSIIFIRDMIINPGRKPETKDLTGLAIFTGSLLLIILIVIFTDLKKKKRKKGV